MWPDECLDNPAIAQLCPRALVQPQNFLQHVFGIAAENGRGVAIGYLRFGKAHRIGDQRVLRMIKRFLKAGVVEEGRLEISDGGYIVSWTREDPDAGETYSFGRVLTRAARIWVGPARLSKRDTAIWS